MAVKKNDTDKAVTAKIQAYMVKNPIERGEKNCYSDVANKFKVTTERVRRIYRTLRENGVVEDAPIAQSKNSFKENVRTGEADVTFVTNKRIKTLAQLLAACEVDANEWEVITFEVNKWEVGRKDKSLDWNVNKGVVEYGRAKDSGKIFVEPLFQVKAKLGRRKLTKDLGLQKEVILKELMGFSSKVKLNLGDRTKYANKSQLLEICIFDAHFGKLAWREETGEDYDLKIAEARVKKSIAKLLSRVNLDNVGRILFPVGNDLINVDNRNNMTTGGTPQDTDARFMKIIKAVRRILIEIITDLSKIAPVDVLIVPGNHDTSSSFMIGEILDAYFHNNERIYIDNSPKMRKYYRFGKNSFQLTHGNEEKHGDLALIFATEEKKLWADTDFRFVQLGHLHKNKKTNYISVDTYQSVTVQILPSLSGTDAWHSKKGYMSQKQAKAILFDAVEGQVGEFTDTCII